MTQHPWRFQAMLLVFPSVLACLAGHAEASCPLTVVQTWGGTVNDVAFVGDHAYVSIGTRLEIYDVSDIANPERVNSIELGFPAAVIEPSGNRVYLLSQWRGLTILDAIAPESPVIQGQFRGLLLYPIDIAIRDNIAIVTTEWYGTYLLDVSDPFAPVELGHNPSDGQTEVEIVGDYAYLCGSHPSFHDEILDISNPAAPVGVDGPADAFLPSIEVRDGRLIELHGSTLTVYDLTTPNSPDAIATTLISPYSSLSWDFTIAGDVGLGVNGDGAILLNLTDLTTPEVVSTLGSGNAHMHRGDLGASKAVLADRNSGARFFNLATPEIPVETAIMGDAAEISFLDRDDNYLYALGRNTGLRIFDVSGGIPELIASRPEMDGNDFEIHGGLLYLAAAHYALEIYDLTIPADPALIGSLDQVSGMIKVDAGFVVLGDGGNWFRLVDASDPTQPTVASTSGFPVGGDSQLVGFHYPYAYFTSPFGPDLSIVDVTMPGQPSGISQFNLQGDYPGIGAFGADIAGDLMCVAGGDGFYVLDLSNQEEPVQIGRWPGPLYYCNVDVVGDRAFVCGGALVFDVSDPTAPRLLQHGGLGFAYLTESVTRGDYIYAAAGEQGLVIFESGTCVLGDMNRDGTLDLLDVEPFVSQLLGQYYSQDWLIADVNGDGLYNGRDLELFIEALLDG